MMDLTQYILLILMSLPAAHRDTESWEERNGRMEVTARAIDAASSRATCTGKFESQDCERIWHGAKKDLALLLVTKGWWESRFAQNVHEGNCAPTECDATKVGNVVVHRARTAWQMQQTGLLTRREWNTMVGTTYKQTRTAAWVAARILSRGKKACHSRFGALSYYGRGRCNWSGARPRIHFYRKLKSKTEEQLQKDRDRRKDIHQEKDRKKQERVALLGDS